MSSFSSYFLTSSTAAVLSAALLLAGPRLAYSAPPVIGGPTFKTIYNSEHTLADVLEPGDRGLVLYFMHDTCPVVQLYVPRLKKLHEEFALQGVRFVGIYANRGDNTFAMARHSLQKDIPFLVLYDKQQLLLDRIGVERTGTAVLLDTAGNVRFHGPVDDQFTKGRAKTAATCHYLRDAIAGLVAGESSTEPVAVAVSGCVITRRDDSVPALSWRHFTRMCCRFFRIAARCAIAQDRCAPFLAAHVSRRRELEGP